VRWANYLQANKVMGIFLFNTNDGQDRDYGAIDPVWREIPIWQFSRRLKSEQNIALMPLDKKYMGPRSENQPKVGLDPFSFRQKEPLIFWRGATNGTKNEGQSIRWLSGEINQVFSIQEHSEQLIEGLSKLRDFLRIRIVENLIDSPIADVGFVHRNGMETPAQIRKWYKPPSPRVEWCKRKYLLALEGNCYATSLYWQLASNSVVLMPSRCWETALDYGLQEGVHFLPVGESRAEIEAVVEHCESNPEMCENIIKNAHDFVELITDNEIRDTIDIETSRRYATIIRELQASGELALSKF